MRKIFFTSLIVFFTLQVFSQVKISSSTFGKMEARWLGPGTMSGRITAIDGVAGDGKTIYVGTAGGGIWKTTNGGATFKPVFDKYCMSIGAIAIDPKNPNTIYVAAPGPLWSNGTQRGLFKSTDGGQTWKKILYINEKAGCADVAIDPSNPDIIYASTWEFRRLPYSFNSG